jgi:hypothetical protein
MSLPGLPGAVAESDLIVMPDLLALPALPVLLELPALPGPVILPELVVLLELVMLDLVTAICDHPSLVPGRENDKAA